MKRLLLMLLAVPAVANAQTPAATPMDTYRACKHPALQDERASEDRFTKLAFLCNTIATDNTKSWSNVAKGWAAAFDPSKLPRAEDVRIFADEAETIAPAASGETLPLPQILFPVGSSVIPAEEVDKVRVIADLVIARLVDHPKEVLTITGTSNGDDSAFERNRDLAQARADAIVAAIRKHDHDNVLRDAIGRRLSTAAHVISEAEVQKKADALRGDRDPNSLVVIKTDGSTRTVTLETKVKLDAQAASRGVQGAAQPLEASKAPSPMSTEQPFSLNGSSLTTALVDAVIQQAREQAQLYLVDEVARGVCSPRRADTMYQYLQSTCALFGQDTRDLYIPTLAGLHQAIRDDARRELPALLVNRIIQQMGKTESVDNSSAVSADWFMPSRLRQMPPTSKVLTLNRNYVAAIAVIYYLQEVLERGDALLALEQLPVRLTDGFRALRLDSVLIADTSVVGKLIGTAAPYARLLREARQWQGDEFQNVVTVEATRALAVNLADHSVDFPRSDLALTTVRKALVAFPNLTEASRRWAGAHDAFMSMKGSDSARVSALAGVLASSMDVLLVPFEDVGVTGTKIDAVREFAIPARQIFAAVAARDYHSALIHATGFLRALSCSDDVLCSNPIRLSQIQLRLLNFTADVANAQDQAQVSQAFKSFLSQNGGYRAKRFGETKSFFTLNAYLGASVTREHGLDDGKAFTGAAFYMPVGVEYVARRPQTNDRDWFPSLSVFLQVLDLGGVAATRYHGGADVDTPSPGLVDLFSPGLYFVVPLGRSPLSFGIGGAMNPRAQMVNVDGTKLKPAGAFRWGPFIAFDVPLFP